MDGDRLLADVPGRPRAVTLPGHTPGSVGYLFADRGLLFTGDALVTYDGITGYRGPAVASRAFTHDSRAALASLTALDTINSGMQTAIMMANMNCFKIIWLFPLARYNRIRVPGRKIGPWVKTLCRRAG